MQIHKEGRKMLVILIMILIVINTIILFFVPDYTWIFNISIIVSIVLFVLVLQFFRNPKVLSTKDDNHILAPADGKVVVIEDVEDPEYFKGTRKQISIFMSPINVHVNRNPVSGKVKYFKYHKGKYLVAWHPKSSTDNERTTIVIQLQNGLEILVRQIAGAMAKRIKYYINEGDSVEQGEEFGFIKFGSRLDILMPTDAAVKVAIGDKTKAGKTILALINEA